MTELRAPLNARLVQWLVQPGDTVQAGQVLVILEAMKMEHEVRAPQAGRIADVFFAADDTVVEGELLLNWELPWHASAVLVLSFLQWPLLIKFLKNPIERALYVSAFGVPIFVSGMMVSAWGLRQLNAAGVA